MQPSKYQQAVYDHVSKMCSPVYGLESSDKTNLIVQAVAGSGKTTTIVGAAEKVPQHMSIIFVCFNKHIAEALQAKLPFNAQAATLNSVGWQICLKHKKVKLDRFKTDGHYKRLFDFNDPKQKSEYWKTKGNVTRLVSLLKANFITRPLLSDVESLADNQGIEISESTANKIIQTYQKCNADTDVMDFDDQIFMPLLQGWTFPKYDILFIDEAQDLNPVMVDFIQNLSKRFVCVGDSRQAIYGFRGADPESMDNIKRRLNCVELPLSICYRCPKSVVAEAQKIVKHIEPSPTAKEGTNEWITEDKLRESMAIGHYILCRTTAPLVSECLKAIKNKKPAVVKGRNIGDDIADLVKKNAIGEQQPIEEFYHEFNEWYQAQRSRLARLEREDQILELDDKVDTVHALAENCDTVGQILENIKQVFSDNTEGCVTFCTVHRSKGLEGHTVFLLKPELMPHPAAKKPWQQIQEQNLKYVAITRSLDKLYWVTTGTTSKKVEKKQ